jgi:SAM-dependent methyltransferase
MDAQTQAWYCENAQTFVQASAAISMESHYAGFLTGVPAGGLILDAGCGSGRDAKRFLEMGYRVAAFDASPEIAAFARASTGIEVTVREFKDVEEEDVYDGVWACASLLHLARDSLISAIGKLARAAKPGSPFFIALPCGNGEFRDTTGRFFARQTAVSLREVFLLAGLPAPERVYVEDGASSQGARRRWLMTISRVPERSPKPAAHRI